MSKVLKCVIVAGAAVLLTGCSTKRIAELDQYPGLKIEKNQQWGYEYIDGITFEYPATKSGGKDVLPVCVAQNVQNKSVTLKGNQGTAFVGGAFWQTGKSETVGGGSVISYVSDDRNTVIADGTNMIDTSAMLVKMENAVTYRLTAKRNPAKTLLAFSNLERAATDSGNIGNPGYNKIGVWSAAKPMQVIGSLKKTADTINTCLGSL